MLSFLIILMNKQRKTEAKKHSVENQNFTPKPQFSKGSSSGGEPTPPPSGKSWLDAYRENPNYSPTGYR